MLCGRHGFAAWSMDTQAQDKTNPNVLWGQRLARFNDWQPAQKVLLLFSVIFPAQLAFKFFFDAMVGPLANFTWLFWCGVGAWGLCAALSLVLTIKHSTSTLPYFAVVYIYGTWLILVSHQTGWLDSAYAMYVVIGISVLALLGSWRAVGHYLALWATATVAIGYAQYAGWLHYGPLYLAPMADVRPSSNWLLMNAAFIVQMAAITLAVLWLVINSRDQAEKALQRSNALVQRYLPPAVAKQIIAGNEHAVSTPVRRRLTVLFADIVGFTEIADRAEPEVITDVLSDYMSHMAEIIQQYNGTLNEFAGDGLMALFGAPERMPPEDQATCAVLAAQAMQQAMPELNARWRRWGLGKELQIRIGINTGVASVGSYGSQGRMTYTAIGLQTNIAARIQSQAAPGESLLSDATYQLIREKFAVDARGDIACKGVHFPVSVFALDPRRS